MLIVHVYKYINIVLKIYGADKLAYKLAYRLAYKVEDILAM